MRNVKSETEPLHDFYENQPYIKRTKADSREDIDTRTETDAAEVITRQLITAQRRRTEMNTKKSCNLVKCTANTTVNRDNNRCGYLLVEEELRLFWRKLRFRFHHRHWNAIH